MPIPVLMPALSPTMSEGTLAKWVKHVGDTVAAGDVLAEIETDKATMEVEAVDEGRLARILVDEGAEGVPVNTAIAVLLEDGEDESALDSYTPPAHTPPNGGGGATSVSPSGAAEATPAASPTFSAPAAPAPAPAPTPAVVAPAPAPRAAGERLFASPLARRIASERGIDLAALRGSGPRGRIVKADVEAASPAAKPPVAALPGAAQPLDAPYDLIKPSTTRKVVARRLTEAKQTVPHFYLTMECRIDRLLALRKEINAGLEGQGIKLSVNDFLIRAAAIALIDAPAANASWTEQGIRRYARADISVAVAIPDGLITPIIRDAAGKGLKAISQEMKALAAKARDGKLMPEDYQGGTFTLSNLGMYGVREFAAIINPPQGCILAVGAGEQRPVVENGALAVGSVMSCTLAVDHRVVDGAVGAEYLGAFKGLVENPLAMLV